MSHHQVKRWSTAQLRCPYKRRVVRNAPPPSIYCHFDLKRKFTLLRKAHQCQCGFGLK